MAIDSAWPRSWFHQFDSKPDCAAFWECSSCGYGEGGYYSSSWCRYCKMPFIGGSQEYKGSKKILKVDWAKCNLQHTEWAKKDV